MERGGRGLGDELETMLGQASALAVPLWYRTADAGIRWVKGGDGQRSLGALAAATPLSLS